MAETSPIVAYWAKELEENKKKLDRLQSAGERYKISQPRNLSGQNKREYHITRIKAEAKILLELKKFYEESLLEASEADEVEALFATNGKSVPTPTTPPAPGPPAPASKPN